jgi:hypothetical protein
MVTWPSIAISDLMTTNHLECHSCRLKDVVVRNDDSALLSGRKARRWGRRVVQTEVGLKTVVSARDLFNRLAAAEADGSGPEQIAQHAYGHARNLFRNIANALGDYLVLARVKLLKGREQFREFCSQFLTRHRH